MRVSVTLVSLRQLSANGQLLYTYASQIKGFRLIYKASGNVYFLSSAPSSHSSTCWDNWFVVFLPFHSSILKPDFYLSFG